MNFKKAFLSRPGGRKNNQDFCSYVESKRFGCYLLADGLGAYRGSGTAARITGESLLEAFAASPGMSVESIMHYLEHARRTLLDVAGNVQGSQNMKTTLVLLVSDFLRARWVHVGDSRLYYFSSGTLAFQTQDHSVSQAMVNAGDIAPQQIRFHEDRNRLTRAFDGSDLSRVAFLQKPVDLQPEDAFLLCSDGFWELVYETEMEEDLLRSKDPETWIDRMQKRLLDRAEPDHDNYTALAVMVS